MSARKPILLTTLLLLALPPANAQIEPTLVHTESGRWDAWALEQFYSWMPHQEPGYEWSTLGAGYVIHYCTEDSLMRVSPYAADLMNRWSAPLPIYAPPVAQIAPRHQHGFATCFLDTTGIAWRYDENDNSLTPLLNLPRFETIRYIHSGNAAATWGFTSLDSSGLTQVFDLEEPDSGAFASWPLDPTTIRLLSPTGYNDHHKTFVWGSQEQACFQLAMGVGGDGWVWDMFHQYRLQDSLFSGPGVIGPLIRPHNPLVPRAEVISDSAGQWSHYVLYISGNGGFVTQQNELSATPRCMDLPNSWSNSSIDSPWRAYALQWASTDSIYITGGAGHGTVLDAGGEVLRLSATTLYSKRDRYSRWAHPLLIWTAWDSIASTSSIFYWTNRPDSLVGTSVPEATDPTPATPRLIQLSRAWPNPFNSSTTVELQLRLPAKVDVHVIDLLGRRVATLARGVRAAGEHRLVWEAADAPSGAYWIVAEAAGQRRTVPLRLVK